MKLQHLAIVFAIIFLPIILVTSYYIQQQVDTINLEEAYDSKLLDATHDAMVAFELNTANEELSTVADSLRSIIEASNNIFFNTLATNLGVSNASKSFVQPYIPAILYTLYDGYYIYAPTNAPVVCTDKYGQTITTSDLGVEFTGTITENGKKIGIYNFYSSSITYLDGTTTAQSSSYEVNYSTLESEDIEEEYGQMLYKNKDGTYSPVQHNSGGDRATYYKQSYILKSFVSYSATYSNNSDIDITINYTLDNFITIEGKIKNTYYTKSGYLIESDLVKEIHVSGVDSEGNSISENFTSMDDWYKISEDKWEELIYNPNACEVIVILNDGTQISNRDGASSEYWDDAQSAVEYYVDAYMFSSWVYKNLSGLEAKWINNNNYTLIDVTETTGGKDINYDTKLYDNMMYDFSEDTTLPFVASSDTVSNDPEDSESAFALHKRNVIKNSVTYNLALAMVTYTEMSRTTEFSLPVLNDVEWDKILSNVSIVAFMQGMNCGLKVYNNYAVVSSTNNEITVTPDEIYYVSAPAGAVATSLEDGLDSGTVETAHRLDCPNLEATNEYVSFKSKEIKYDKIYNKTDTKYVYDHHVYTDYTCLVSSNYLVNGYETTTSTEKVNKKGNKGILDFLLTQVQVETDGTIKAGYQKKLKAYRIAVAKERNNTYKSIAYTENYGYAIINFGTDPSKVENGEKISGSKTITGSEATATSGITLAEINMPICEISKVEIITSAISKPDTTDTYDIMRVTLGTGNQYDSKNYSYQIKDRNETEWEKEFSDTSILDKITISFGNSDTSIYLKSIKIYYK